MCTRPTQFQEIGKRYPDFIADLLGGMDDILCWLVFARMSTTVTGRPIPYDVGAWGVNFYVGNVNGTSEGSGSYYFV